MMIEELNERSRDIFVQIVEAYLAHGEPVGSQTVSQRLSGKLSSASVRNVMADLERHGLLFSPHISAGRIPTEAGLRLFVDGLLEIGNLTGEERERIEARCRMEGRSVEEALTDATAMLSGLAKAAALVLAPKIDSPLKHVEFVSLEPRRALAVLVSEDGSVENRVIELPSGITPSALLEATNYLSARLRGRTLEEAREDILHEISDKRAELDSLTSKVVEAGLATWGGSARETLIVRGRANLLDDLTAREDLERIRQLFEDLESRRDFSQLLELTQDAQGVRIFIGSENKLFSLSGSALIVSPYLNARRQVLGVIGVIGPTRVNYGRVIPVVDYTAQVIGRLLG